MIIHLMVNHHMEIPLCEFSEFYVVPDWSASDLIFAFNPIRLEWMILKRQASAYRPNFLYIKLDKARDVIIMDYGYMIKINPPEHPDTYETELSHYVNFKQLAEDIDKTFGNKLNTEKQLQQFAAVQLAKSNPNAKHEVYKKINIDQNEWICNEGNRFTVRIQTMMQQDLWLIGKL